MIQGGSLRFGSARLGSKRGSQVRGEVHGSPQIGSGRFGLK
jgi:hypothetical protein